MSELLFLFAKKLWFLSGALVFCIYAYHDFRSLFGKASTGSRSLRQLRKAAVEAAFGIGAVICFFLKSGNALENIGGAVILGAFILMILSEEPYLNW